MTAVKLGVGYRVAVDPDLGAFAAAVENMGFDSVWIGEHIANWHRPMMTVIPALGAFAARTQRVQIGSAVLLLPLRNPTLIAKELATVDLISGGRLVVGVGLGGENAAEYAACGVPLSERGARTDEMLRILPRLWREPAVTYRGKHFVLEEVTIDPRPSRPGGPPIYVAGRQEAALRRAARYGDGFMPYLYTPGQYATAFRKVRAFAERYDRDLACFEGALYQFIAVAQTQGEARQMAVDALGEAYSQDFSKLVDKFCVLGTPADCIARLREYVAAGATHIILAPATPHEAIAGQLTLIAEQILPAFR